MHLCRPLLAHMKIEDKFMPYYRRVQEHAKKQRHRQLPFLSVSKQPSIRPPIPDPRDKLGLMKIDLAREMNVKTGDRVQVLFGSEKGKQGVITRLVQDGKNTVIVSGINLKRSFWHPEPGPGRPSIVSVECPIHITNVVLLDPVTKQPTRVKRRYMMNGECVRISKVSGSAMPDPVPVGMSERELLWAKHESQALVKEKARRGPLKEDVFGNRDHFKTLVRIVKGQAAKPGGSAAAEQSAAGDPW
eukprot:CAMPEP_0183442648 /NCGR_PEP_ID=MMETSP0370-20130417/88939_1 /TAXON_ID=268820 /ORGANISM="Peridinium aciculiferum, Strain PAER-2" /LENGTH=244 /DNA_ID=CAMNT_0025632345 /DNA_START=69 /DNA_END=803 /DNA_ORIENTATION=-